VTTTTKPKRRLLRFSLRTLLIFMLVVCVAVGWKYERVRKQREVVAWVQEMGGLVYYDFELDERGYERITETPGHEWVRKWLGRDFFAEVTGVELNFTEVSDVSPLAELTKLKQLYLYNTQVSDVRPLAKLSKLEVLDLNGTQVSDVSPLAKLTNLEMLYLRDTKNARLHVSGCGDEVMHIEPESLSGQSGGLNCAQAGCADR